MANLKIESCDSLITTSNKLCVKNGVLQNQVNRLNEEKISQNCELNMANWEIENLKEDYKDLKQKLNSSSLQFNKLEQG